METEPKTPKAKATHKHRKASQGGFYSEFKVYNPKGKTFKELMLMIEDLKANVRYQLYRINKMKYAFKMQSGVKDQDKYNARRMARERLHSHNRTRKVVADLRDEVRELKKERDSLQRKVEYRDKSLLLKKKRETRVVYKTKAELKVVLRDPKPVEPKMLRVMNKPFSDRVHNTLELLTRTRVFLIRYNGLTYVQLALMMHAEGFEGFTSIEVVEELRTAIPYCVSSGYLKKDRITSTMNLYHLTSKGQKIVEDYKNYLSYGKNPLLT